MDESPALPAIASAPHDESAVPSVVAAHHHALESTALAVASLVGIVYVAGATRGWATLALGAGVLGAMVLAYRGVCRANVRVSAGAGGLRVRREGGVFRRPREWLLPWSAVRLATVSERPARVSLTGAHPVLPLTGTAPEPELRAFVARLRPHVLNLVENGPRQMEERRRADAERAMRTSPAWGLLPLTLLGWGALQLVLGDGPASWSTILSISLGVTGLLGYVQNARVLRAARREAERLRAAGEPDPESPAVSAPDGGP